MEATPYSEALQSYLIRLRDTATQEIEARKPVELESQDTPEVVPALIDATANSLVPQTPEESSSPRLFASLSEAFTYHAGRLLLLGRPGIEIPG